MGLSTIILAAGQGTRMRSNLPKVLQPLAGRPLLAHVLDCSAALAADDVCIVYGHGAEAVRNEFPDESLRWALMLCNFVYLLSFYYYFRASRTLESDMNASKQ